MRYTLYRWGWAALDLLFPPNCASCNRTGTRWCQECRHQTIQIEPPFCQLCGQPTTSPSICPSCKVFPPSLIAIRSWAVFEGPVRKALHRVKYSRDLALAETLAREMFHVTQDQGWDLDLIVPVPLSKKRLRERGFNQAVLLARPLAWRMSIPSNSKALRRIRDTLSQVGLNVEQRRDNVSEAFVASSKQVVGKNILLVDDVATSGSTLNACANALWNAQAKNVYGLTLTRAVQST